MDQLVPSVFEGLPVIPLLDDDPDASAITLETHYERKYMKILFNPAFPVSEVLEKMEQARGNIKRTKMHVAAVLGMDLAELEERSRLIAG